MTNSINTYQPAALLYNNQLTDVAEKIIGLVPDTASLPRHNAQELTIIKKPECPEKEDFTYDDDGKPQLDEEEFNSAMDSYYSELEAYNLHIKSGHYTIGLLLGNREFLPVYFSMDKPRPFREGGQTTTAKEVQTAIKAGTATPELLQAEIDRIKQREKRSAELDTEKVQLTIHNLMSEYAAEPGNNKTLTKADRNGARLIIYQSLDYSTREKVRLVLFPKQKDKFREEGKEVYEVLSKLSDRQFSYLIRMALCGKSESKYPSQVAGYFLYQVAKEAGIPVQTVEKEQAQKATDRKERQDLKIKDLKDKIKKLKTETK